ncbi:TPA: hypothetical protein ACH3X1_008746 [Trebouxia sp. C0004]
MVTAFAPDKCQDSVKIWSRSLAAGICRYAWESLPTTGPMHCCMGQAVESSTQGPKVTDSPQMPIRPRFNEPLKIADRAGATEQAQKAVSTVPAWHCQLQKAVSPAPKAVGRPQRLCPLLRKRLQYLHDHSCIGAVTEAPCTACKRQTGAAAHLMVRKQAKARILTTAR